MKRFLRILPALVLLLTAGVLPPDTHGQPVPPPGTIPAFEIGDESVGDTRLAQPDTYFDQTGRRFAVLGSEDGTLEIWGWPLKIARDMTISFFPGGGTDPIRGRDIVYRIDARPSATTLTYVYQSFTVRMHVVAAPDSAGAVLFLDVDSTEPLSIVFGLIPTLQPMWPAGIGGQYAYWDGNRKAYLISESSRRNSAWIGSPAAAGLSYTPAHMLSEQPNQFRIDIPDTAAMQGRFIPVIMAGGPAQREATGATYDALAADPEAVYTAAREHFSSLASRTMSVRTPVPELDRALEWAKVSYDGLLVDNPHIPGTGFTAGFAKAGRGGRPGFGWFFGGDTYINVLSLNAVGAFDESRAALEFMTQFQRDDGKMAHEITQAVDYVDWFGDYPYSYIHADTSPYFIVAMHDYAVRSGDLDFVRKHWDTILKAHAWSAATDTDGDGLMDNEAAGLGALEFGALTGIQTDIYLGAVWVQSLQALARLATLLGHDGIAQDARASFGTASAAFEQFWDADIGQYAYAFNATRETVAEVTPWSAVGLLFGFGIDDRARSTLQRMARADLSTDWGTRMMSTGSTYYEPLNYNYGAVWPFLTSWVTTAQYTRGMPLQGWSNLMASVGHVYRRSLGDITEVFSGDAHTWPQESVPHQGFCTAATVLPFVRGLLGITVDAPANVLTWSPALPADWSFLEANRVALGADRTADLSFSRNGDTDTYVVAANGVDVVLAPNYPPGTHIGSVTLDGQELDVEAVAGTYGTTLSIPFRASGRSEVSIQLDRPASPLAPVWKTDVGDANKGLRIVSYRVESDHGILEVEGRRGSTYRLGLAEAGRARAVEGARLDGSDLMVTFPTGPDEWTMQTIRFSVR